MFMRYIFFMCYFFLQFILANLNREYLFDRTFQNFIDLILIKTLFKPHN